MLEYIEGIFIKAVNIRELVKEKERKLFSKKVDILSRLLVYSDRLVLCRDDRRIDDGTFYNQQIIMKDNSFEKVVYHTEKRVVTLYGIFTVKNYSTELVSKEVQEVYDIGKLVIKLSDSDSVCNLLQMLPTDITYKRPYRYVQV